MPLLALVGNVEGTNTILIYEHTVSPSKLQGDRRYDNIDSIMHSTCEDVMVSSSIRVCSKLKASGMSVATHHTIPPHSDGIYAYTSWCEARNLHKSSARLTTTTMYISVNHGEYNA